MTSARFCFCLLTLSALALPPLPSLAQSPNLRGNVGIHDPSTIIKCKDKYYIFGTGQGIITKSSSDKIFWSTGPRVFAAAPTWTTNLVPLFDGTIWAPDVIYLNGRYCLYYAVSSWGSQISAIGLATNPTLDPNDTAYRWTDQGPVITSGSGYPYNTIDPSLTLDASGNPWMSFGSYWNGIYLVQLDPATGLRISTGSPLYRLAYNSSIEASCIFRRGGYYYLFANWGSCCSGVNSTYNIRVGRSTTITGPYLDRNGVDMVSNGGTLFLQGTGKFTGPGHVGVLSEGGRQVFSYHYYDANAWAPWYNAYGPADFDIEPLTWTADNWPVFTNDWSAVYRFEADAHDDNGQYDGRLLNGASIASDPVRGHVLNLNGTKQFVRLPAGVAYARTFTAVVKWNGGAPWQRIFDFGTDTSRYVMLTPSSDTGKVRCDIKAGAGVQTLLGTAALPVGVWTHVAVTLDGTWGVLYVNGIAVASRSNMTIAPLDVLAQTNYLGHSKFAADPDFNGQISSFKAYGRYLSGAEITAPQPTIVEPVDSSSYWPGSRIQFSGRATDFMDAALDATHFTWRAEYSRDGHTNVVFGPVSGIPEGWFFTSTNAAETGAYRVYLTATDSAGRQNTVSSVLVPANSKIDSSSFYPFVSDAKDSNGHYDGVLNGGAGFRLDPLRGPVLNLSGSGQYVSLPPGAASFKTFMAWVKWNGGGAWQRIIDFGNDTNRYTVLTPSAANGKLRFNISLNSIAGEQVIDAPGPLPAGAWTHVAVVLDGKAGVLYTNGVPVATNGNVNLIPENLNVTNAFLGKSQWPADPYLNGQLSAVRFFSRALRPEEIVAPQCNIASPVHGSLYQPGQLITFSGSAADFFEATIPASRLAWTVQYIVPGLTNTVLGPIAGATNGSYVIPANGSAATNGCYRITLAATDNVNRSGSAYVDVFPASAAGAGGPWTSFYPFFFGALDASNRFNGTLAGGATTTLDQERGSVLDLSGVSQYASLPAAVGNCQTVAGWVNWDGGAAWQRVFDFGRDTEHFFMLTPRDSDGKMQCAITSARSDYVQVVQADVPLPSNGWNYVAVTLDGRQGVLSLNSQVAGVNNSVNLLPADVSPLTCFLGRSHYPADPFFSGRLDSVKISSAPLLLADLLAPTVRFLLPAAGTRYSGGEVVAYSAAATDFTDLPLPASSFTWSGDFLHDNQSDPAFGPLSGVTNGTLQVSQAGPLTTNALYRLAVSVTDTNGNTTVARVDVPPRVANVNLETIPAGLQVSLDGQPFVGPSSVGLVAGMTRTLAAAPFQGFGGSNYDFVLWSDGGAPTHTLTVPANDSTFTASYVQPTLSVNGTPSRVDITWPAWAAPLQLFQTTNLVAPVTWTSITNKAVLSDGSIQLSLPASEQQLFFRLMPP